VKIDKNSLSRSQTALVLQSLALVRTDTKTLSEALATHPIPTEQSSFLFMRTSFDAELPTFTW